MSAEQKAKAEANRLAALKRLEEHKKLVKEVAFIDNL
jgi:hypothetical protein